MVLIFLLSALSGMFSLGIVGVMRTAGMPDAVVRYAMPVIVYFAIPLAFSPFIMRMAVYKEYRGFEMRVERVPNDAAEDLGYAESAKLAWYVAWRVFAGIAAFSVLWLCISLVIPVEGAAGGPGSRANSPWFPYVGAVMHALVIFAFIPIGIWSMLRIQFQGFELHVTRTAHPPLAQIR